MSWHRKLPNQAACGSCCGIKEKLQTLWDRTINSILRINQVEPDDQGNIRIRSDNEALTVTEGTNEIVLNLDTSELPAASVISVNGETGAVQLSGDDIPSLYNGTVNSNIAGLWSTKAQRTDLNTEITNRQNADTALQNNINALQASIPQEAADAVAADPTVQSFAAAAAAIPDKVDKRTGAGLRAYTHTGSTQDDTVVEDSTNGATIPIRDANGRLHAADPAAGATDKTLVTANWVSQTGDSGPNNLVHKNGNETIPGIKTFESNILRTNVSAGRNVLKVMGTSGNCYIYTVRDINGHSRGSINHQTIISGDHATRTVLQLISDDYDTTAGTGAIASLTLELIPTGRLQLRLNTTTGDGRTASQTIATLTPS